MSPRTAQQQQQQQQQSRQWRAVADYRGRCRSAPAPLGLRLQAGLAIRRLGIPGITSCYVTRSCSSLLSIVIATPPRFDRMRLPYPTDKGRGERVYLVDVVVVVIVEFVFENGLLPCSLARHVPVSETNQHGRRQLSPPYPCPIRRSGPFVSPMHLNSLDPGRSRFSAFCATCILRNPRVYPRLSPDCSCRGHERAWRASRTNV